MGSNERDRAPGMKSFGPDVLYEVASRMERGPKLARDGFLLFAEDDGPVVQETTPENLAAFRARLLASLGEAAARDFDESVSAADRCSGDQCRCESSWSFQRLDVDDGPDAFDLEIAAVRSPSPRNLRRLRRRSRG